MKKIEAEEHVQMLKQGRQMLAKRDIPEAITLEELDKVIKTLKKEKSPDLEGSRYEWLKEGEEDIRKSTVMMLNNIQDEREVPKQ